MSNHIVGEPSAKTANLRRVLLAAAVGGLTLGAFALGRSTAGTESSSSVSSALGAPDVQPTASSPDSKDDNGDGGTWTVHEATDPMTDGKVTRALAMFPAEQFDVQVAVSCASDGTITYVASTFTKDGTPAEMRARVVPFGRQEQVGVWKPYQIRVGERPALELASRDAPYSNQLSFKTYPVQPLAGDGSITDLAENAARASNIVLRLLLKTGEATVTWSQDVPAFQRMIGPCLTLRTDKRTVQTREAQEAAAEPAPLPMDK